MTDTLRSEPPLEPPDYDDTPRCSMQPLGAAKVLVDFESDPTVEIVGAWIGNEFVGADCFAESQLAAWRAAIADELDSERDEAQQGLEFA